MYGEQEVLPNPEKNNDAAEIPVDGADPATALQFGQDWNPNELKMLERVKNNKRQKRQNEGEGMLAEQDFIGFSKTSNLKVAKDEDYLYEEGVEMQKQLIHDEDIDMVQVGQQIEEDEEEEKHIMQLVKNGTMGQK